MPLFLTGHYLVMEELVGMLGTLLLLLVGAGAALATAGLFTEQLASVPSARRRGREAVGAGCTMMAYAAAAYVLVRVLPIMFGSLMSNLP